MNEFTSDSTKPMIAAPMATPIAVPTFSLSTGSVHHAAVAATITVPSVIAVRVTTSSMVITSGRAGACGAPWMSVCA